MSSGAATTIHLVRHASHGLLPHTLAGRVAGVALDAAGREQALGLAARFAGASVAGVVSSPVQRAVETAKPVAAAFGLEPQLDPAFEEIDFGAWAGQRFEALSTDPDWIAWNRLRSLAACPGGESMHQAQSRALAGLTKLRTPYAGRQVIVVSHADIIKSVLAAAIGMPLDRLDRFTIDPASISTLHLFDADIRVDGINR